MAEIDKLDMPRQEIHLLTLAEKELAAFIRAVSELFGAEQARRSALDWIKELKLLDWSMGEEVPDLRQVTVRASAGLCSLSMNLEKQTKRIQRRVSDEKFR